jgi:hypothetical protein
MEFHGYTSLKEDHEIVIIVENEPVLRMIEIAVTQLEKWIRSNWRGEVTRDRKNRSSQAEQGKTYYLHIVQLEDDGESYSIDIDTEAARIVGGPKGILHGVQTLIQLLAYRTTGTATIEIPLISIEDRPDIPVRGLFVECFWGSDLMELQDWQAMIDEMVEFKLNMLTIGVYGGWFPRHPLESQSPPDFLYVPILDQVEQLPRTRIRYFDPESKQMSSLSYLPVIYEQDLLGSIIEYAVERGIQVAPLFNGPGHSLLLPKLYPELAAVDSRNQSIGIGLTLTHPDTFPLLKRINQTIIDTYLKPYGQKWFHIGMDEVTLWSHADLINHTPKQLLYMYLVEIGGHLIDNGIEKVIIWHDCAEHLGHFDEEFEQLLENHGLAGKLVIHWWKYGEPEIGIRPVQGAETWVAPSTGFTPGTCAQDYLDNIDMMVNDGKQSSLQGVVSYMLYSPTLRRNTAYLSEKSWNTDAQADQFELRYARTLVQDHQEEWAAGMRKMRQIFGGDSPTSMLLLELSVFFGDSNPELAYPARLINSMRAVRGTRRAYDAIVTVLEKVLRLFEWGEPARGREAELAVSRLYCKQIIALIRTFVCVTHSIQKFERIRKGPPEHRAQLYQIKSSLEKALWELDSMFMEMKQQLPHYLVPSGLREYTFLREALLKHLREIEGILQNDSIMNGTEELPSPSMPGIC